LPTCGASNTGLFPRGVDLLLVDAGTVTAWCARAHRRRAAGQRHLARAVGLDDRGEIAVGKRADLVRVQPHDLPATELHPRGRRRVS
jgi:hypothetical protein